MANCDNCEYVNYLKVINYSRLACFDVKFYSVNTFFVVKLGNLAEADEK